MFSIKENSKGLDDFINFLQMISEKKKGENIDTTFGNLKVYFIGKSEVLKKYALAPYYKRIENDAKNGTNIFYLLAYGNYCIAAASVLSTLLSEDGIIQVDDKYIGEISHEGKKMKVAVVRMVHNGFTHEPPRSC